VREAEREIFMSNAPSSQSLLEAIFHLAADPMDTSNSDHLAALRKIAALADNAMRGGSMRTFTMMAFRSRTAS